FTELETYCAYWDFHDVMDEAEGIIRAAAKVVSEDGKINYQGTDIDLGKSFRRVHMVDLIKEKSGVDFWQPMTDDEAKK
ncbi:amino acid--tRNA ligase-related protein, partial [Lactobacillus gasseri]